jgi:hypothetical protein
MPSLVDTSSEMAGFAVMEPVITGVAGFVGTIPSAFKYAAGRKGTALASELTSGVMA